MQKQEGSRRRRLASNLFRYDMNLRLVPLIRAHGVMVRPVRRMMGVAAGSHHEGQPSQITVARLAGRIADKRVNFSRGQSGVKWTMQWPYCKGLPYMTSAVGGGVPKKQTKRTKSADL